MPDWPPSSKPIPADGLKARSQRGGIGESWWSRRFVAALEAANVGGRMARGRTYARKGQVLELGVAPGVVVARVQGSRAKPYALTIGMAPLTDAEWERVEAVLASRALFLAKLLAGEMPQEIEEAFDAAGCPLFPATHRDLRTDCSCPDWENPCKHIAASLFLLAEAFDDDPFLIFAWRGRSREALLASLRAARGSTVVDDGRPAASDGWPSADDEPGDAADGPDGFWSSPDAHRVDQRPRAAPVPDALLRELDPLDLTIRGRRVTDILSGRYAEIAEAAERRALDDG